MADRTCTCLGSCKGTDGLAPGWTCALERPAPRSTRLRVTSVWYEQPTARAAELGRASIRITTDVGHFHRDVPLTVEGLRDARAVARFCGVQLVIAYELREVVAGWEVSHV